tara:strand:- start:147 stop:563 length:417 start_codon:yes stop_codon:yes gene_type:complete
MKYKNIIVSVYEVEQDKKVIQSALDIAEKFESKLTVLHVNTPRSKFPSRVSHILEPLYTEAELEKEFAQLNQTNVSATIKIIDADEPDEGIIGTIKGYDLLVIGHRNMNWLESTISDSTDEIIINEIYCDCLVVTLDE